jgi:5-methylcytosine-specific restriction endonuclease McrA
MLLVEETKTRFGYDGTQWGTTSTKKVVVKCDVCGKVRVAMANAINKPCQPCGCALKAGQRKESRTYESKVGLTSTVLVEETIAAFGYDPTKLTKGSNRPVLRKCGGCGKVEKKPCRHGAYPCQGCAVSEKFRQKREANEPLGLTARGNSIAELGQRHREYKAAWHRGKYAEEVYRFKRILYASIGTMKLKGFNCGHLPYTAGEFNAHIERLLSEQDYKCPICGDDIKLFFQIDHKKPCANATTKEELLTLFALENLWPICGHCNMAVKKARNLDEILPVSENSQVVSPPVG